MTWMKSPLSLSVFAAIAVALPILVSGCAPPVPDGPPRYELSGSVTFDGKPVPAGEMILSPDTTQGNAGPGAIVMIKDGQYQTEPGAGIVGGAYTVQILGFDGVATEQSPEGTSIFPTYETTVEFPTENTTHDFEVPGS